MKMGVSARWHPFFKINKQTRINYMAITTTDKKLRVLRTNNFKNKAASERQQFDNDAIIFDASGGIYIGDGVNKEPILVAGAISAKDANTGVIDDPTVNLTSVKFVAQTLTDAQKAQARTNIGAVSSDEVDAGVVWEYY